MRRGPSGDGPGRPLRLCMVVPYFPPYAPGGGEFSSAEQCRRLALAGHRVAVVVPDYAGSPRVETRDGYDIHWAASPMRLQPGQQGDGSGYLGTRAFARELAASVAKVAAAVDADVVHALNTQVYAPAVAAARRLGVRVVGTVRDPGVLCPTGMCMMDDRRQPPVPCAGLGDMIRCSTEFGRRIGFSLPAHKRTLHALRLYRARERSRALLRRMDGSVAVSAALADAMTAAGVVPRGHVRVVYNFPGDVPRFSADEVRACAARHGLQGSPYFVVPGRKSLGKGTALAAGAAERLAEAAGDARVVFAGTGAAATGAGVVDLPSLSQDELHRLMAGSRGLLVPSLVFEGFPRGILDALALGIPLVVTSSAGGAPEGVVQGQNGFVVPPHDPGAMADALRRVLDGGEAFAAQAGRTAAELLSTRFSVAAGVAALENLYRGDEAS